MFKFKGLGEIQGNPLQQQYKQLTSRIYFQEPPTEPPVEPPPSPPSADWKAGLPDEIRNHPSMASFKDPADLAKSWVNVQPMVGLEKIPIPGKDSPPEIRRQAFHKLGLPEKEEDYKYARPSMSENYPVDEELEGELVKTAYQVGVLPDQLEAIFNKYYELTDQSFINLQEQNTANMEKLDASLRRKWGRQYESNAAIADKMISHFANDEFKGFLEDSGLGNDPRMIDFMVTVGKSISEDKIVGLPKSSYKSPAEAANEITRLYADEDFMKAYNNKNHPGHQEAVNRMFGLQQQANPEEG